MPIPSPENRPPQPPPVATPEANSADYETWLAQAAPPAEDDGAPVDHDETSVPSEPAGLAPAPQHYADSDQPTTQKDVEAAYSNMEAALGQARIDPLTGIPSQLGLDARVESIWGVKDSDPSYHPESRRRRPNTPSHAIIVQLDMSELKLANNISKSLGNELLRRFGQQLASMARDTDLVARNMIGGDDANAETDPVHASQEAREAGDDFRIVIPLSNELSEDDRLAVLQTVLERYRNEFSRPRTFDQDGKPDPRGRITQMGAIWKQYEANAAAWDADPRFADVKGPRPSAAGLELFPLASVGAAMGQIIPDGDTYELDEPNRNYHRIRQAAEAMEHEHAAQMVANGITNPRPTPTLGDTLPDAS